jgi:hypothetical protein
MKKLTDRFLLIGAAFLYIVVAGSGFLLADKFHIGPVWVILGSACVGLIAAAGWDYRDQLRSKGFPFFVVWLLINVLLFALLFVFGWFCGWGCVPN